METPRFFSSSGELALDQLEAGLERLRLGRRIGAASARSKSSTIDSRSLMHVGGRPLDHVLAIALDALAEVVEFGGLAQQAIVEIVAFLLQRVRRGGHAAGLRRVVGRGRAGDPAGRWVGRS